MHTYIPTQDSFVYYKNVFAQTDSDFNILLINRVDCLEEDCSKSVGFHEDNNI